MYIGRDECVTGDCILISSNYVEVMKLLIHQDISEDLFA